MGDKCEWKDGKFEGCKIGKEWDRHVVDFNGEGLAKKVIACPFCGADIRKPEPAEPLIVKSGETLVKYENGVNSICLNPEGEEIYHLYKSFTGPDPDIVELTDEIAKLRPIVMVRNHINNALVKTKLTYIESDSNLDDPYKYHTIIGPWPNCHLATAQELQESEC